MNFVVCKINIKSIISICSSNLAQQNLQERSNGETSQCIPWTNDEIDRMVKARLDLPVVEKLRQEGYSMAIIR